MTGAIPDHSILTFALSNPSGQGQGDVVKLLRSLADSVESLGDVQIEDITFSSSVTAEEDDLVFDVYYHPEPRRR
jgi:hypothetical protein